MIRFINDTFYFLCLFSLSVILARSQNNKSRQFPVINFIANFGPQIDWYQHFRAMQDIIILVHIYYFKLAKLGSCTDISASRVGVYIRIFGGTKSNNLFTVCCTRIIISIILFVLPRLKCWSIIIFQLFYRQQRGGSKLNHESGANVFYWKMRVVETNV